MQLSQHIEQVRQQLRSAAALGDERTQQIAASLADTVSPAVQLAVMSALSSAADQITAAMLDLPGSPAVSVSMDGDDTHGDLRIDVRASAVEPNVPPETADDGDATARISLRLSESLKGEIEGAARRDGVSVNTWLVRVAARAAARTTTHGHAHDIAQDALRRAGSAQRITGWING